METPPPSLSARGMYVMTMMMPLHTDESRTDGDTRRNDADAVCAAELQQHAGSSVVGIGGTGCGEAVTADDAGRGGGGRRRRLSPRGGGIDLAGGRGAAHVRLTALVGTCVVAAAVLDAVALVERAEVVRDCLRVLRQVWAAAIAAHAHVEEVLLGGRG